MVKDGNNKQWLRKDRNVEKVKTKTEKIIKGTKGTKYKS